MTAIITGDIINSQLVELPKSYLEKIRNTLSSLGNEHEAWEIFRGDSFQLEIKKAEEVFWKSVYIKACLKCFKELDARMAIGIGEKSFEADSISEATGTAFIRSGEIFEKLKTEKSNLLIHTGNLEHNIELNAYFQLALIAMDNWTSNSAEIVKLTIENPTFNQQQIGNLIGIKQNTVSERQKRAAWEQLKNFDLIFRQKIRAL